MSIIYGDKLGINFMVWAGNGVELNQNDYSLGFFGKNRLTPVEIGEWQEAMFLVDESVGSGYVQTPNIEYYSSTHAILDGVYPAIPLINIPNYQATLNVRFKNDASVRVYNAECRLFDRNNINAAPSGVFVKLAEIVHTSRLQNNAEGKGHSSWQDVDSGQLISLFNSPGESGQYAGIVNYRSDNRHDWYLAISMSPKTLGKRDQVGLYVSLEYL